jgi:hypothetical protein
MKQCIVLCCALAAVAAGAQESSLVLADGGLEFPDGTLQMSAAACGPAAPVPRTGQSGVSAAGDDGDYQLGVVWPNPRFTDHGDGTVTDNLTGLIWLDDANCFDQLTWAEALAKAADLSDGCADCGGANMDCGLQDGSIAGEWRLPNVRELQSLVHYGEFNPALPDTAGTGHWAEGDPFSGALDEWYWSSTWLHQDSSFAWGVNFNNGMVSRYLKTSTFYVWPVRGGQ